MRVYFYLIISLLALIAWGHPVLSAQEVVIVFTADTAGYVLPCG